MPDDKKPETDGEKKFREMGEKLKKEKEEKQVVEEQGKELALNNLNAIRQNAELAKMYQESAKVGADNLASELPLLKVHQVGKSTKNELSDGSEPNDGWFFYKPTAEQFKDVRCHILTISRGFRAEGIDNQKDVFNQIVGGVILDGKDYKPFILYMTGLKLSYLWEFGKSASKFTRMKPIPVPMFALVVKMTTEKISNNYGKSWIIKFEIEKDAEGNPVLVGDPGEFQYLKDNVETVEDTIAALIETKTAKEDEDMVHHAEKAFGVKAQPAQSAQPVQNAEDIPF